MTSDELLELESLARGASGGHWRAVNRGVGWEIHRDDATALDAKRETFPEWGTCWCKSETCCGELPSGMRTDLQEADASYIAAAQPSAVLALIERIRHLEQTLEAERKDVDRAREFIGYGGYAGDAPREILLAAERDMGCDAWLNLQRVYAAGEGKTNLDRMTHIRWTEPVLYVRADTVERTLHLEERLRVLEWEEDTRRLYE